MKDWQEAIYKVYTEAKQFEAGKYHPRFGETPRKFRERGSSAPSRDAMIFLSNLLEYIGIFTEDETDSVVKNFNAAERRLRFLELLEIHSEEIKSSADDIDDQYAPQFEKFFKVEAANRGQRGRGEKYSANAAAIEMAKRQKEELQQLKSMATGGAADALNVLSAGLDEAENEMFGSLKMTFEQDTIELHIDLSDPAQTGEVANKIKSLIGDSEVEASINVPVNSNTAIAKLIERIGKDKVIDAINREIGYNIDDEPNVFISTLDGTIKLGIMLRDSKLTYIKDIINYIKPYIGNSEIYTNISATAGPNTELARLTAELGPRAAGSSILKRLGDAVEEIRIFPPHEPGSAERLVAPEARRVPMNDPEDTDEEPEYGSDLPDAPEMGDEERYSPRSFREPSFGDDEDFGGDSDYTPSWAREEEEHEGARRSPEEGEYDRSEDYDEDAFNDEADLDDDGELSEYERKRGSAINKSMRKKDENNEDIKMSPQQINQWMYNQRTSRMQNNLRQNERWGNY